MHENHFQANTDWNQLKTQQPEAAVQNDGWDDQAAKVDDWGQNADWDNQQQNNDAGNADWDNQQQNNDAGNADDGNQVQF